MDLITEANLDSVRSLKDEIKHLQWLLMALAGELGKYLEEGREDEGGDN